MKICLPLFLVFLTLGASAQSSSEQILLTEKAKLLEEMGNLKQSLETYRNNIEAGRAELKANEERLQNLEDYEENFQSNKRQALVTLEKLKGRFNKCLRKSLEEQNVLNYEMCSKRFRPKIKNEGKEQLEAWKLSLSLSLPEVNKEKKKLMDLIPRNREIIKKQKEWYQYTVKRSGAVEEELQASEIKLSEIKLLPKFSKFTKCDTNTPDINLENETPFPGALFKGPFHGVPRDNQDGLGTCFANTAKNLIVGLSEGNDIASFLDLALLYKDDQNQVVGDGLDGGSTCSTLKTAKVKGYCPQRYSPLETGERNEVGEGLFRLGKYEYLASNVNFLKDFLQDLSVFEKSNSVVKEDVLLRSQNLIENLKRNKDIIIPVPVARFPVVEEWKLKEFHAVQNLKDRLPLDDFLREYRKEYSKFYPSYVKSVLAGKNLEAIFENYQEKMSGFLSKYNFSSSLPQMKQMFFRNASAEMNDPGLKQKVRASLDFLKKTLQKDSMKDEDFLDYCVTSGTESLNFLSSLQTLVNKIRDDKIDSDRLFDEKGRFKSARDLMQLTVAPSCLNSENRVKLPAFTCDNGYQTISKIKASGKSIEEQIEMLREKVVLSLVQGYPLGNSYPTGPSSAHINTIAGMRFNPKTNSCEYLIRESQNGQSDWHSEKTIFGKIQGLTEVRRIP
ncbi:MAG: hypothetical protein ACLGHN_01225 [Bacteriovoracia bacterium]